MACTDQCTCNGTDTDDLAPLERAFLRDYLFVMGAGASDVEGERYAKRQAETVRAYQREAGVVEVSKNAWNDLLDELASTRREAEAYRFNWADAEKKVAADREDHANVVHCLREEIDRMHDEIRVARTLIRAADKALS